MRSAEVQLLPHVTRGETWRVETGHQGQGDWNEPDSASTTNTHMNPVGFYKDQFYMWVMRREQRSRVLLLILSCVTHLNAEALPRLLNKILGETLEWECQHIIRHHHTQITARLETLHQCARPSLSDWFYYTDTSHVDLNRFKRVVESCK